MLRVCVIGLGHIGNLHARIYQEDELVDLVGVCDINEERAVAASKKLGVPYYLDAPTMLKELKPDLVSVATGGYEYSSDHYLPTIQALEAGCHVLCEKPISNLIENGQKMVDTAARLNRCFAIDFNHRFTPAARAAKKWQDEGLIGDLLFCNMALWIGKPQPLESPYYHLKALNPHSCEIIRFMFRPIWRLSSWAMWTRCSASP